MRVSTEEVASLVKTATEAESIIADLLVRFGSNTTYQRLSEEASVQRQSIPTVASRTTNNLLRSFKTRRDCW